MRHSQLHDVFEPMDVITAFSDMPVLVNVVFGSANVIRFNAELESLDKTQQSNPELAHILETQFIPFFRAGNSFISIIIKSLFSSRFSLTGVGAFKASSRSLDANAYDTLTLPDSLLRKCWIKTRLLKIDGKFAWTILPHTMFVYHIYSFFGVLIITY